MSRVPIRQRRKADFDSLWLITFADLMVQLMAFFVVVYSFSQQDQARLNEVLSHFQQAVGLKPEGSVTPKPGAAQGVGPLPGATGILPDRTSDLEKLLSDLKATDGPDVGTRMRIVSFRGSILFEEGRTDLDPVFTPLLDRMAQLASRYPGFNLVAEGHGAPGEKGRGGSDVLDLSGMRAQAVVRYLASKGMDPKHMTAEARGDAYVEGDPESPEGRALQRRVKFRFQRLAER